MPLPRRKGREGRVFTTLWDAVWASVPCRDEDNPPPEGPGEAWAKVFPWLTAARTSENGRSTTPEHGHPLQCYFGTPRRIRLSFDGTAVSVRSFRQQHRGVKYEGWLHPHSPYRADKQSGKLPFHPQPGGATYRDWLTWLAGSTDRTTEPAAAIRSWAERVKRLPPIEAGDAWQSGVLACGFDTDNSKVRGWLEVRIPYFDPPLDADPARWCAQFFGSAGQLVAGADDAGRRLRHGCRLAKFGSRDRNGGYSLPKTSPGKSAFEDLYETFWRETEPDFRAAIETLRERPADATWEVRRAFCSALRRKALQLFDEIAGTDTLADQDARRIVETRSMLTYAFGETGSVRIALDIVTAEAQAKAAKRRNAKQKEPA